MFNLYQLVTGAQGGQGLENLAQQFGLSRDQADGAVRALVPALSTAFMAKAAQPGGLGAIAGAMGDDQHRQAYADPGAAQQPGTQQKGSDVAGSIFGDNAIVEQVVAQAARFTGLPEATLRAMLPVIVSLVMGGAATALHNGGMGGMLGQLAHGGIGGIFGQFGGAATGQGAPGNTGGAGSFAGMVGNIMNSFLGGAHPANPQEPVPPTTHPARRRAVPACHQRPTPRRRQRPGREPAADGPGRPRHVRQDVPGRRARLARPAGRSRRQDRRQPRGKRMKGATR